MPNDSHNSALYILSDGGQFASLALDSPHPIEIYGEFWSSAAEYCSHSPGVRDYMRLNPDESPWDWREDISDLTNHWPERIMEISIWAKFEQHPELLRLLLSTGDAPLLYQVAHPNWGIGTDGNGDNWVGKILMKVRHYCEWVCCTSDKQWPDVPKLHFETTRIINREDPMGLLASGCKRDEYSLEVERIVPRLSTTLTVEELADIIHEVFHQMFRGIHGRLVESYLPAASELHTIRQKLKGTRAK
jgi:predicted NAD-dependent protein-ADP-ribosyltransferase YbiA (DUF1768 family)